MSKLRKSLKSSVAYLPALAIVLGNQCLAGPVWIPSESMEPTMQAGDVLLVNRLAYGMHLPLFSTAEIARWSTPLRGDVIVFNAPHEASSLESLFIKRVVAVAGDTVQVKNQQITLNGQPVTYASLAGGETETIAGVAHAVRTEQSPLENFGPFTVPAGQVFVMGDNRAHSSDSRVWGALPLERIRGRASYRLAGLNPDNFKAPGTL